jgi:hypothetical protein
MNEDERRMLADAIAERVTQNAKELLETVAEWGINARERAKAWLWFFLFVGLAVRLAAKRDVNAYLVLLSVIALYWSFGWWLRWRDRKRWQGVQDPKGVWIASERFRRFVRCKEILEHMSSVELAAVPAEIVDWFIGSAWFWENHGEQILFPAFRQMRIENLGGTRENPAYLELVAEMFKRYEKLDPDSVWLLKLQRDAKDSPS